MSRLYAAITIVLVLALAGNAVAEWQHFDNNADIRALHQEGDTLWIGTNGGVLLMDLLTGEIGRKISAGASLPGNSIRAIKGRRGTVYVGTDQGLSVFGRRRVSVYPESENYFFSDIRSIDFGTLGETYVGTFGHGIVVMDPPDSRADFKRVTRLDSLLDDKVYAVADIDTGRVYYATSLGFCAYRDSAWVSFQAGAGLPRGEVKQLIEVGDDRFYLLIGGRGLYRFNHNRSVRIQSDDVFDDNEIAAIALGNDGAIWAGGLFGGIARYRRDSWTPFGEGDKDVTGAKWRCAYSAPGGAIFFGSSDGLLVAIEDGRLRKFFIPSILPSGHVGPIAEDMEGHKYIVNGPYLLSLGERSDRFELETQPGSVFAIATSPSGEVWISTPWGLLRRDGSNWVEVFAEIEPKPPVFISLVFDAVGNLWGGTHTGEVYRYDGDLWVRYADRHELPMGPIFRLLIDHSQTLWAVSRDEGIHRYEGFQWRTFPTAEFDSLAIQDATLDATGWPVVITERGIWRFGNERGWERILAEDPVAIGRYRSIYFDGMGRMYVGTTEGLALVADGPSSFIRATDGLLGREVTSLMIDREDYLWVGFRFDGVSRISLEYLW